MAAMEVNAHLVNYTRGYFSVMLKTLSKFAYVVPGVQMHEKRARKKSVIGVL